MAANVFGHGAEPHPAEKGHDHSKAEETAFGRAADPAKAQRTIVVEMRDSFEFSPSEITVKAGEVVRFVAVNTGEHVHEMVLGTMKDLTEHEESMKEHPGMPHHEPHMARVAGGKSGVIVWQFTQPGEFYFGCLVDDHFESGMMGKIHVTGQPMAAGASQHRDHSYAVYGHFKIGVGGLVSRYSLPSELESSYGNRR